LLASPAGYARMKEMIPTFDEDMKLPAHADRFRAVRQRADEILQLR
jgi:malate dehydrogenase (quinone)